MHLLPILHGHAVTDIGGAVAAVPVCFFRDPELRKGFLAFFIFRPCVEIAYPFPIVIDLYKVGPFRFGIGGNVCAIQNSHAGQQNACEAQEFKCSLAAAAPEGTNPLGKPEHARHGKHQIENILSHAVGNPCKNIGGYITFQKIGYRIIDSCRRKAEKSGCRGHTCNRGVLCFGEYIEIYNKEKNTEDRQCGFPERIGTAMTIP